MPSPSSRPDTDIRRLLMEAIQRSSISLAQLSRRLGRNHAYLYQFIHKGSPQRLNYEDEIKLRRWLGLASGDLPVPAMAQMSQDNWRHFRTLSVTNAALAPLLLPGDLVLVDESIHSPIADHLYALGDDQTPLFRRCVLNDPEQSWRGNLTIIGKVCWIMRKP